MFFLLDPLLQNLIKIISVSNAIRLSPVPLLTNGVACREAIFYFPDDRQPMKTEAQIVSNN